MPPPSADALIELAKTSDPSRSMPANALLHSDLTTVRATELRSRLSRVDHHSGQMAQGSLSLPDPAATALQGAPASGIAR